MKKTIKKQFVQTNANDARNDATNDTHKNDVLPTNDTTNDGINTNKNVLNDEQCDVLIDAIKKRTNNAQTFRCVDVANVANRDAKTLRAKTRKNIAMFRDLFANDMKHCYHIKDARTILRALLS